MIIGPPGSGKTTALLESGLNFPYTSGGGRGIKGVGGTRNCDWWFTDQGILLDTAGRYTTELEDRDEWIGFLGMLKKCRKEKPINGVIVAISISDLINATDEEMEAHSKNIRDRVDELSKQLEMVFPVYLIFTKCDLLNGFTDFFEDFTKEDREQMWGMTLPYKQQGDTDFGALFNEECKKFYETLRHQRVNALSTDRKSDKKRNIYSFPLQFALAHKRLGEFVGMLFRTNPFQESPILRGIFMTSGTQEGFPIDQVVGAMSEAFGLAAESGGLMGGEGEKKSYFINNLFTKLIFPDQKLAQISSKVARRKRFVRWGMGFGSVAALGIFAFLLVVSFVANSTLLASTKSAATDVKENSNKDLAKRLKSLNHLQKKLRELEENEAEGPPLTYRFGLYRGNSILDETRTLYNQHLHTLFLKRLKELIGSELNERLAQKGPGSGEKRIESFFGDLFALNYTYQRLGGKSLPEDKNRTLIYDVLTEPKYNFLNKLKEPGDDSKNLWIEALGSDKALSEDENTDAKAQLKFYIEHIGAGFGFDETLVNRVNAQLGRNFWIDEEYHRLTSYSFSQNSPPALTLEQLAGSAGARFLEPKLESVLEGQPAGTVPGIFTQDGWNGYMEISISEHSQDLVTRLHLMGITTKTQKDIENSLIDRYEVDLKNYWNKFIQSIHVKEFKSIQEARKFLQLLTNTRTSPIFQVFDRAWSRRVVTIKGKKFNEPITESGGEPDRVKDWWPKTNDAYKTVRNWLGTFLDNYQGSFQKLIDAGPGPLGELTTNFNQANGKLEDAGESIFTDQVLKAIVLTVLKEPITEVLLLLQRKAKMEMNSLWEELVYKPYSTNMKDSYPFNRDRNNSDISWDHFCDLFGFNEAAFFKVESYVNKLDPISVMDQDLLQKSSVFDAAKKKATAFRKLFPDDNDGTKRLSVSFRLHFQNANSKSTNFVLGTININGLDVSTTRKLTWTQGENVKLNAVPNDGTGKTKDFYPIGSLGDRQNSPWALFRLLDSGRFIPKAADKFQLEWELTAKDKLRITLIAETTKNCFGKDFFNFTCPEKVVE
ncbi:MAG: type VI secretion system membrane subunit TssM [Planctomycetota bacterium]|nr:type VI secretion system membrane subunit TssM [Planctomycetota bacterium]